KDFATRLFRDLKASRYHVVLDREYELKLHETLYLLTRCQNVILLNDIHYVESCLLGKVPITQPTSAFPSFAFPADKGQSEEYVGEVMKIAAVTWEVARQLKDMGNKQAAELAISVARPDAFKKAPDLRLFMEGWRVDEVQMVFLNIKRY